MGSQATREADGVLFTRAGLEIGVAATKTFVCQVAVIYLLALRLAELRGTLPPSGIAELVGELKRLPHCISQIAGPLIVEGLARPGRARPARHRSAGPRDRRRALAQEFFLYIGRHVGLPVALEGALKLKEISYIATDAYAAGEMKHGPIALLDESTPVVCVATDSPVLEKIVSNIQEVRARGAHVIALTTAGNDADRQARRRRDRGARARLDAAADPRRDPAAAARLRDRPPARAERRPAAQPREDRHRRVAPPGWALGSLVVGTLPDWCEPLPDAETMRAIDRWAIERAAGCPRWT